MSASPTDRTKLRRMPERGSHDRAVLDAILDEGIVCHVGFVQDDAPSSSRPATSATATASCCTAPAPAA